MGLLSILKKVKEKEKELRILILGLDNAGKTTILRKFCGDPIDTIEPTLGFNIKTLEHHGYSLNIWDVGGQKTIRAYWRNYFERTDGLIWVVDSADQVRLEICRKELCGLLEQEKLAGASLLIFANKQDVNGALTAEEIAESLGLRETSSFQNRHWSIRGCSAVTGEGLVEEQFNSNRRLRQMPIQTGLQPMINAPTSRTLLPCNCTNCGTASTKHLIETFIVSTEDTDKLPSVARKVLCGSCLVGHDAAVMRPSCNEWCFGEVVDYDSSKLHPFVMLFSDGMKEWVYISPTPSDDYLNCIGIGLPGTTLMPTNTMDQSSIGTFYSSSMSAMSSFDHAHVLPLFDDENLMHFDSLSSLDDSFSDDEVEPTQPVQPTNRGSKKSSARARKKNPNARASGVLWTPEEDRNLIAVVEEIEKSGRSLKWPEVAKDCPNRNGKQCRERYINHLSSTLNISEWSPREDEVLFAAIFRTGKSWCKLAKLLNGRTDNAIKNRFHHLKRRLNKDFRRKVRQYSNMVDQSDDESPVEGDSVEAIFHTARKLLKVLSAESKRRTTNPYMKGYVFGPFVPVNDNAKMCPRCGLFIPSAQTGNSICSKTKWCEACTMMPPYVAHGMLRECLDMRRDNDSMIGVSLL